LNGHGILETSMLTVRRLFFAALCGLAALLTPNLAQADPVRADLDGDGLYDRIEFGHGSHELAIRLSRTHRWHRLASPDLIVKLVVTDVDHDGDADLVAHTRESGLHVWINKGRGMFAARGRHAAGRRARLAFHHSRPSVHSIRVARLDDSTLNDSSRFVVVDSTPTHTRLIFQGEPLDAPGASPATYPCLRRASRGPPDLLVS
jgi:hypothetical protein